MSLDDIFPRVPELDYEKRVDNCPECMARNITPATVERVPNGAQCAYEIIDPIMSSGAVAHISEYDVDAIADEVLGDYHQGYASQVDADEFWTIVEKHAK